MGRTARRRPAQSAVDGDQRLGVCHSATHTRAPTSSPRAAEAERQQATPTCRAGSSQPSGRPWPARACFQARRACAAQPAPPGEGERAPTTAHPSTGAARTRRCSRAHARREPAGCSDGVGTDTRAALVFVDDDGHRGGVEEQGGRLLPRRLRRHRIAANLDYRRESAAGARRCRRRLRGRGRRRGRGDWPPPRDGSHSHVPGPSIGVSRSQKDGAAAAQRRGRRRHRGCHARPRRQVSSRSAPTCSLELSSMPRAARQPGPGSLGTAAGGGASGGVIAGGCAAGCRRGRAGGQAICRGHCRCPARTDAARRPRRGIGDGAAARSASRPARPARSASTLARRIDQRLAPWRWRADAAGARHGRRWRRGAAAASHASCSAAWIGSLLLVGSAGGGGWTACPATGAMAF